jgi:tetratricopeptide (TPR) repeat protein
MVVQLAEAGHPWTITQSGGRVENETPTDVLTALHGKAGGPSGRRIAEFSGREISSSSAASLLKGAGNHRSDTVLGFIRGCFRYARSRKAVGQPQPEHDEGWWYDRYLTAVRAMPLAPTGPTATPGTSLLPIRASRFVGRDDVVREVLDLLQQQRAADMPLGVHVFDGMGGVGKTECVVQIGHQVAGEFPDGVVFLDLAGYRQGMEPIPPAQALQLLLAQRGIVPGEMQYGEAVLRALWRSECAGRRILIILDNARDQEQVVPLLPDAAECLVLITTRRAFIGLSDSTPRKLEVLSPEKAADLLRSTAGLAPHQHAAQVEDVVRLCGRLPLAIVIAGSMLAYRPGYTPAELASDLQRERTFLEDLDEDDGSLHIEVHACLRLSYRYLPDNLMMAFQLCGWHPGPEVTEPAMAVMLVEPNLPDRPVQISDRMTAQARRLLMSLADRNLLRMQTDTHRFRMHDLIRASAQLLRSDDAEDQREHVLASLNRAYLVTLLHVERWRIGGQLPELGLPRAWLADTPLDAIPDLYAAEAWVRRERENLLAFVDVIDSRRSAFALDILAGQLRDLGMLADAEHCYLAAERGFGVLGLDYARAHVLRGLADVVARRGDYTAARSAYQRSKAISRRSRDHLGLAMTLAGLGGVAYVVDDLEAAESYLRRAVKLFAGQELVRRCDHVAVREYGSALVRLARVQQARGQEQSAMELMGQALHAYSLADDVRGLQGLIPQMADICQSLGNSEVARNVLNQLLDDMQLLDDTKAEALWQLGRIEAVTGDPLRAITLFQQALHLYEESKQPLGEARALIGLADAERLAGRLDDARAHFEQARRLCAGLDDHSGVAQATLGLGDVAQRTGDHTMATRQWQQALLLATEVGAVGVTVVRKARRRLGQDTDE